MASAFFVFRFDSNYDPRRPLDAALSASDSRFRKGRRDVAGLSVGITDGTKPLRRRVLPWSFCC